MKCYICGKGNLKKQKVEFKLYGVVIGKFPAEVCGKCGEQFFDEKTSDEIDKKIKEKELWGLEANTKISKAGDSLVVRINSKLAKFLDIKKGQEVSLRPEDKDKLVIEV